MRGGSASVTGTRYVRRSDTGKNNKPRLIRFFFRITLSQCLPTGIFFQIEATDKKEVDLLKTNLNTRDDKRVGYILNRESDCSLKIHRKAEKFPFPSEEKKSKQRSFCLFEEN